jgi:glyoxylase-like metal-dependent hydrolase (beta-lactamase superfamily II)
MPREVLPNLFRIKIPLPDNPLKAVNSYVVRGNPRSLIIDTGLNRIECQEAMMEGLRLIGVDLSRADFFITHVHADHYALLSKLVGSANRVYFNGPDAAIIKDQGLWDAVISYAGLNGFPENLLQDALRNHPGYKYAPDWIPEFILLQQDDHIEAGDYSFRCIETPGHTPGHICLYEPAKKVLVSGDHLLIDITPNIQCWREGVDPLKSYLQSLDKIYGLEVDLVLPGHRRLFNDHRQRIDELKQHHRRRAAEVLTILSRKPGTAFEVASQMTWDIKYDSWELFPVPQKWFATAEALSHLRYLENQGRVRRYSDDGLLRFALTARADLAETLES